MKTGEPTVNSANVIKEYAPQEKIKLFDGRYKRRITKHCVGERKKRKIVLVK